jgi:hypothetical protein
MICPEQEGQDNGAPVRSWEMSCRAWAGLYVAGRGLRMRTSMGVRLTIPPGLELPAGMLLPAT